MESQGPTRRRGGRIKHDKSDTDSFLDARKRMVNDA